MRRMIFSLVVLLLLASGASAQYIEEGDREVQFSGTMFAVSGVTVINLSGIYGKYVNEKTEIGGGPSITYSKVSFLGFSESSTTVGATAFIRRNLTAKDRMVPYLAGQWFQYDLAPDEPAGFTDFSYIQVGAGFKYFLNENVAYDVSGNLGYSLGASEICFMAAVGVAAIF